MLEAINLHKVYKQPRAALHVLKGIDLKIREGDILAIVGPSGAGKSTLLHILGGLDKPNDGHVIFDNEDLYRLKDQQRAKIRNEKIGFVFQFYHLLPEFTALENVLLPALVKGGPSRMEGLKSKAGALLDQVGLNQRYHHKPNELSGGEQQRVAIARSLINDPKIIFCDEPTGNLDSENGEAIIELLMGLNTKNKQALVIVTHDESIANRSQKIIYLKDGMIVECRALA